MSGDTGDLRSVLIRAYNNKFQTDGIPNPLSTDTLDKVIDAFVDDADPRGIVLDTNITLEELLSIECKNELNTGKNSCLLPAADYSTCRNAIGTTSSGHEMTTANHISD